MRKTNVRTTRFNGEIGWELGNQQRNVAHSSIAREWIILMNLGGMWALNGPIYLEDYGLSNCKCVDRDLILFTMLLAAWHSKCTSSELLEVDDRI